MGFMSSIANRMANPDEIRKEDDVLYYEGSHGIQQDILDGEYEGFEYQIKTFGTYPIIFLNKETLFVNNIGSSQSLFNFKDRNGKTIKMYRSIIVRAGWLKDKVQYSHPYNGKEDLILGDHPGHKYTVQELEADCKAIIDQVKDM